MYPKTQLKLHTPGVNVLRWYWIVIIGWTYFFLITTLLRQFYPKWCLHISMSCKRKHKVGWCRFRERIFKRQYKWGILGHVTWDEKLDKDLCTKYMHLNFLMATTCLKFSQSGLVNNLLNGLGITMSLKSLTNMA